MYHSGTAGCCTPCEELIDLINRSDSEALFLSPKLKHIWMHFLQTVRNFRRCGCSRKRWRMCLQRYTVSMSFEMMGKSASADSVCPDAEDIATIIFTSGTTGKSKGVMLTQNNLASNVEAVKISAEPGTAMLSVLPIHHAFCLVMDWLKGFSQGQLSVSMTPCFIWSGI